MTIQVLILFFSAFLGGVLSFFIPSANQRQYKLMLVFAGAYLFAITIIHIMPELFAHANNPTRIGIWVLVGFFLQQVLEYFTAGAEHGHVHEHHQAKHHHGLRSSLFVLAAMGIHAFLEGSLLAHPGIVHDDHNTYGLLSGIALHKVPAAFALMSIVICQLRKKRLSILFLVLFSLASPAGMLIGDLYLSATALPKDTFVILFALVCGNFLYISTTIVFESGVDHRFNARKLIVAIIGALLAIFTESYGVII